MANCRKPSVRTVSLWSLVLLVGMLATASLTAQAAVNTCRARNVTQGAQASSDLQAVISAASKGDTIAIKFVCVGNFTIGKTLNLLGKPTAGLPRPILHANGAGRTLRVSAKVTLTNLKITGGDVSGSRWGGGIYATSASILTLNDTIVTGNHAEAVGGVYSAGSVTLNGSSSVRNNSASGDGGLFLDGSNATLTLNDNSSVSGNSAGPSGFGGGIHIYYGSVTMNDASSVSGNTAWAGGGFFDQFGYIKMFGSSTISGNTANTGGGIWGDYYAQVTLSGSSSVFGNGAAADGGGIAATRNSSVTMNDSSSVTGNTADGDDTAGGAGGGIFVDCYSFLTGAVEGGNVTDNYVGTASPAVSNIVVQTC